MPRKGDLHINPLRALQFLHSPPQFSQPECWQLHPSLATSTFHWLTLTREGWKEYNSRQREGSLKRFLHHHLRYISAWPLSIDWLHLGTGPHSPDAPRPYLMGPLCPIPNHGSPVVLLNFQMAPKLILLISSGSRKKEPRCICLSDCLHNSTYTFVPLGCGLKTVSYRIPGFHEQFFGVLQAYLVYSKNW